MRTDSNSGLLAKCPYVSCQIPQKFVAFLWEQEEAWRKHFCVCCTLYYCFMSLESFDYFLVRISTENKAILLEKLVSVLCQIRVM